MAHQIYNPSQSLGTVGRGSSTLGYGGSRGYDNPLFSRENGGGAFDPAGFSSRESRYFSADPKTHTIEPDKTGGLSLTSERYFDRLLSERTQVEAGGRFGSLGIDRYIPSEVATQRLDSSRYHPGPSSSLLGGDSSLFRGSDTAVGYGLSSTYFPGRSLVSPPLHQTVWPGADPRATMGVVTGVKRPNEEVSNQQTLGAHNKFGQNEAFLSLNALAKRPRLDSSSDLPIYPQRPGEKDCAHYMITRTCKFGAECKFDHPTWVPAGGIPDWKEVSSVASSSGPPPERPGEAECPYYMKTGICKFGAKCKFHHPKDRVENSKSLDHKADGSEAKSAESNGEQLPNRPGEPECDYFMKTGNCKFGAKCKFDHPKDKRESVNASDQKVEVDGVQTGGKDESGIAGSVDGKTEKKFTPLKPALGQNSKGLPIRPAETDCPFYVKTGSCKYGANCRFNHPERTINPPSTVMPFIAQNQPLVGYPGIIPQHPVGVNIPPQRPGQPECTFYMKTGECKFGPSCKFNHPLIRHEPSQKLTLAGLPRREGETVCSFYLKTGICKFGANCKFDHPPPGELDPAHAQPTVKLTLAGYPRREGELTCEFYMKTGTCKYGSTCKYDHPPPGEAVAKAVAKASTNGNASNDENELDTDLVKVKVKADEDAQDDEDEQNLL
ncbi:zinc finger CCCH domain-containing protein 8 isoform X1 [Cryptomeria japonica]|uniref:zinc finger CCCH domain-containing protein 8 isoform X1 n=1 Tax=Cryptomeria japonica TaxID=3369 RepID=UPI0025ABEA66|nr:zinc finger CCCH domain-containing protein 8 isoform X1 [Cryptomeria japonica]XP_057817521.1 zinc finger CCCH domain-containing protein 8 isoform X1 [Cryptomeria japonica]